MKLTKTLLNSLTLGISIATFTNPSFALADKEVWQEARKAYDKNDYVQMATLLVPLAAKGNKEAQYLLGLAYKEGAGVDKNLTLAKSWLKKSAEQGYADAQNDLALLYANEGNFGQFFEWAQKSATQGNARGQLFLGIYYQNEEEQDTALMWLDKACQGGEKGACELAKQVRNGEK